LAYRGRNEIRGGCLLSDGGWATGDATQGDFDFTAGTVVLGGRVIDLAAATTRRPLNVSAGLWGISLDLAGTGVIAAISAAGYLDANDRDARCTVILIDSNLNGGATGAPLYCAVWGAGAATGAALAPTNTQVAAAIAASSANAAGSNLSGNGGWVHVAQVTVNRAVSTGNYSVTAVTENRNNRLYI
tara:strand:+ start:203 stop:763 length:561 start_codon:yes stop_codon:yes gene_type:complete